MAATILAPGIRGGAVSTPVSVRGGTFTTNGDFGHMTRLGKTTYMGVKARGLVIKTVKSFTHY